MRAGSANLTLILSIIAAALAFTAAIIRYSADGEVRWSLIAAAAFILAFGVGAKRRGSRP
jgi:hypothetical protein